MSDPAKRKPTALDVFIECLHNIQELEPVDRQRVIAALSRLSTFDERLLLSDSESTP